MNHPKKTLIFGRHPVLDAIRSGTPFDKLVLLQDLRGSFEKEIRQLSKLHNIPVQVVPKERLARLVKGNHQGVVGFLSFLSYYRLEDVLPGVFEKSETPLILLLDGITDVRNFGAIARSSEICGVHALVVPKKGSAQINAEALKASAGALTKIPVCREGSLITAIDFLRLSGIQVLASDLNASKRIYDLDFTLPTAIVLGSEGRGLSPAALKKVEQKFVIPQIGSTDSFNVSVATGIILYEAQRQRAGSWQ